MDRVPLLWEGTEVGELTMEPDALYTWFTARCRLPGEGLWHVWIVGDRGQVRLGIAEPQKGIRRRLSRQTAAPLGTVLRGELRPAGEEGWHPAPEPDRMFQNPWLRQKLQGMAGVLTQKTGELRLLALPYREEQPFPLPPLFCLGQLRRISERTYIVYAFTADDRPVFL